MNTGGGAWCPRAVTPESDGGYEFLEINLIDVTVVTALSIQGRWDYGHGREFVRKFRLEYQRGTRMWRQYSHLNQTEVRALTPFMEGVHQKLTNLRSQNVL